MTANDIIMLNGAIGAILVPPIVQFLKSCSWPDVYKRGLAFLVCVIIAAVEYFAVGNHFESFAISVPLLFAAATTAYHLFFQDKLGALEQMNPLGAKTTVPK